jgi:hypothetical protein
LDASGTLVARNGQLWHQGLHPPLKERGSICVVCLALAILFAL